MKKLILFACIMSLSLFSQNMGARYLIITHDNFYNAVQPLAEWKHKTGLFTKVVKVSDIGGSSSAIRTYIVSAYNNWVIPPEYVLFVGAPNFIPLPTVNGTYSDNYYTNMDGDIYNEILPGRLTVHSESEANNVVNKILAYERNPDLTDSTWMTSACLIVREDYDAYDDSIYWGDLNHAAHLMSAYNYDRIDTLSRAAGHNSSHVINSVNDGCGFVLYRGQGVNNWWSPFDVDPNQTQNGAKLPVVLSITCRTIGTGSSPATAEYWLLTGSASSPRGACGYFASTTIVTSGAYLRSAVCRGFFDAIFTDKKKTFGEASESGRQRVYDLYGSSSEFNGFMTLGDPAMMLWTGRPQAIDVSHDTVLYVGVESTLVQVTLNGQPAESAFVCLSMDTLFYRTGYVDNGLISLNLDGLLPGQLDITVTGRNFLPYESTIPVSDTTAYLIVQSHNCNDSLGNNDGILQAGETIITNVTVGNIGLSIAQSVRGLLRSDDQYVSVIDSLSFYGNILVGDSGSGNSPFVFTIAPDLPSAHVAHCSVILIDMYSNHWYGSFDLDLTTEHGAVGPDPYGYYIYDDTDSLSGQEPVYDWFEIMPPGPGALVTEITNEDADTVTYSLPFDFKYYGLNNNGVGICSNGFIELGRSSYRFGDNGPIPQVGGPRALVAGFWDDLNPAAAGDIYFYYDTTGHRWMLEFNDCGHYDDPSVRETFQMILLDPQYYPTPTGDGEILIQYHTVGDALSNSVGIEDQTEIIGLEYVMNGAYDVNAAVLADQRALRITTTPPLGTFNTPWLFLTSCIVDDSAYGNGNSIAEPGETINLVLTIKNLGDTIADNVDLLLRCADPDFILSDSVSTLASIMPDSSITNLNDLLTGTISTDPADSTIPLILGIDANGGSYTTIDYYTLYIYGIQEVKEITERNVQRHSLDIVPSLFRSKTTIKVNAVNGHYLRSIRIYDVTGRLVKNFVSTGPRNSAVSKINWDGTDQNGRKLSSGLYFISADFGQDRLIKKAVILR